MGIIHDALDALSEKRIRWAKGSWTSVAYREGKKQTPTVCVMGALGWAIIQRNETYMENAQKQRVMLNSMSSEQLVNLMSARDIEEVEAMFKVVIEQYPEFTRRIKRENPHLFDGEEFKLNRVTDEFKIAMLTTWNDSYAKREDIPRVLEKTAIRLAEQV